jgi:hypothetical protein
MRACKIAGYGWRRGIGQCYSAGARAGIPKDMHVSACMRTCITHNPPPHPTHIPQTQPMYLPGPRSPSPSCETQAAYSDIHEHCSHAHAYMCTYVHLMATAHDDSVLQKCGKEMNIAHMVSTNSARWRAPLCLASSVRRLPVFLVLLMYTCP